MLNVLVVCVCIVKKNIFNKLESTWKKKKKKVELLNLQLGVVTCFISSQGTEDKKIILASCLCFPDMINIFHFIILCNWYFYWFNLIFMFHTYSSLNIILFDNLINGFVELLSSDFIFQKMATSKKYKS